MRTSEINAADLPVNIDWRDKRCVGPVKDQESCGSCWAFATTAILESAHCINTGQLLSFSEQLFVSCVKNVSGYGYISEPQPCCGGCNGGDYDATFAWAGNNSIQLVLEENERYLAVDGVCNYDGKGKTNVMVESYTDIPANNSAAMKVALA